MDLFTLVATLGLDTSGFTSGLQGAESALGGFGSLGMGALSLAGKGFSSLSRLAIDFGKDILETGAKTDKSFSAVQAVLGKTEGTVDNMNRLYARAMEVASDSIFTLEQTGDAYYYMGMAGWKTEQMLAGLPGVIDLAAASGEDLGKVSDIVTDSITAFGLSANDVSWYVDILAQTATNANTDVKRMGDTFKYVAPIAGALGADVDDVALSIGLMANAGIKGSMAGTALRNIFTRISTNAGATKKDLGALEIITEKLGVQFWDASGKMRDWGDIIHECREAWSDLSEEQQVYYAKQIASQRGMAGWLALMNATEEDVRKLEKALQDSKGAAESMADVRLDNLWGDIVIFNSKLDILKNTIFGEIKGPARELVQWASGAIERITEAVGLNGLTGGIKQLAIELKNAGEMLAPVFESIGEMLGPLITTLVSTLTQEGSEFMLSAGKLGAALAKGMINGITGEFIGSGSATANGFGWLFKLLGANPLAGGSTKSKGTSGSIHGGAGAKFGDFRYTGLGFQKSYDLASIKEYVNAYKNASKSIEKDASAMWVSISNVMKSQMNDSSKNVSDTFNKFFVSSASDASNEATRDLESKMGRSSSAINKTLGNMISDAISAAGDTGSTKAASSLNRIMGAASSKMSSNMENDLASAGSSGGSRMKDNLVSNIEKGHSSIKKGLVTTLGDAGADGGSSAAKNLSKNIGSKNDAMKQTLANALGKAGDTAGNDIANRIKNILKVAKFAITVVGTIASLAKNSQKFASAMSGGRILHGATVFGMSNNGEPLIGGEAGPEAIIGTDSLSRLITNAVNAGRNDGDIYNNTINVYQQPGEDMDALVEKIERVITRHEKQRRAAYST